MMPFLKIGQNSLYANYRVAKILVDYPRINNGSKYIKSTKYSIEKKTCDSCVETTSVDKLKKLGVTLQ